MANEPQGNDQYITELDVRIWLRDLDPEANLLIDDFEFTPEEVRTAMTLCVDKWNDTPPFMVTYQYNLRTFPFRSAFLTGTSANLLFIAANRYRRNSLKYAVPGGSVADQEKYEEYDAAGERLAKRYDEWLHHAKRSLNMEQGWGVIDSGLGDYFLRGR